MNSKRTAPPREDSDWFELCCGVPHFFRLAILVAICACETGSLTQIVIETDTDYGEELTRVEWVLRGSDGVPIDPIRSVDVTEGTEFPLRLTIIPSGDPDSGVSVLARGFSGSEVLVEQQRTTQFVEGTSAVLRLELSRLCAGVNCTAGESCLNIEDEVRCTSAAVPPESLPLFRPERNNGTNELCNGRDDDGDELIDEGYDFMDTPLHCGGCFPDCNDPAGGNGSVTCSSGICGYACAEGFDDCDGSETNGCEADLRDPGNCGDCDTACSGATPLCGGEGCTDMCDPLTVCGGSCRDTQTDSENCGECGLSCDVENGTAMCLAGECDVTCVMNFHQCGDTCVSDFDVQTCGESCSPCGGEGAESVESVSCDGSQCVLACADDTFDCDGDATTGCETILFGDDPRNCGGCGIDCGYGTCTAGLCSTSVVSVALGSRHTCATLADGTIWCWGANESGQSSPTRSSEMELEPSYVGRATSPLTTRLDDRTSYFYENTLSLTGEVSFWGLDPRVDPSIAESLPLTSLGRGSATGGLAVGGGTGYFTIRPSITSSNQLFGFGRTANAAFNPYGVGDTGYLTPERIADAETVYRGERESCVILGNELHCWGTGTAADPVYLGDGTHLGSETRVRITAGREDAIRGGAVDIGFGTACAGFYANRVEEAVYHCWGDWNGCGDMDSLSPEPVGVQATGAGLTVGESFACKVNLAEGTMSCWGEDFGGTCNPLRYEPFALTDVRAAQLGRDHGCFMRGLEDYPGAVLPRALYCWGNNDFGQLGDGTTTASAEPVQVVFRSPPPDM